MSEGLYRGAVKIFLGYKVFWLFLAYIRPILCWQLVKCEQERRGKPYKGPAAVSVSSNLKMYANGLHIVAQEFVWTGLEDMHTVRKPEGLKSPSFFFIKAEDLSCQVPSTFCYTFFRNDKKNDLREGDK